MVDKPARNHGRYFLTLVFASIFLISVGIVSHNAFADIVISDEPSCVSLEGVWDSATNTCTLHSSAIGSTINSSEILSCSGITLDSGGFLVESSGSLIVKPDCTFNDHGFTVSNGTIINEGVFNNFAGVEVTNIFNNTGIFNNNSTFQNYNSIPTILTNTGTINNYHSIGNQDIINNLGIINNEIGAGITDNDLINNKMGGTINNDGTIYILSVLFPGTDPPVFSNGTLNNYGLINNNADGTIDNESVLNNECGGTIVNNGKISGNQTINISCQPNTVPGPPTALTAIPKMPPQIILSWSAPSDNGSTPLLGYMIERSTDNGTSWNTIIQNTNNTATTFTDSHLKPVKTYSYRVSAINSIGTSDLSDIVSTKPILTHDKKASN